MPTLAIRVPQHVLTTCCVTGVARSMVMFKLSVHPDATQTQMLMVDTTPGRSIALANAGTNVELTNRWSLSEKRLVPLEASVAESIRTIV